VLPNDERSFIIPITWHAQVGEIVICLQDWLSCRVIKMDINILWLK
jgi:hypothetical protein